jgi:GTP-binding protein
MRELIPGGDGGGGGQHLSSSSSTTTTIDRSSTGTELVRTNKSGLVFKEKTGFLVDLDSPGQSILVAEGGAAGVGNKGSLLTYSEQRQDELRPHITGGKGVVRFLELELKIIADVGLVGFPNAGKSSFLASVSKVSCCFFIYSCS